VGKIRINRVDFGGCFNGERDYTARFLLLEVGDTAQKGLKSG